MAYQHPGKLYIKENGLIEAGEDVRQYAQWLRRESGITSSPPIDLSQVYERFGIPEPKRVPLDAQQALLVNPDRGIILVKEDDPQLRQRFSEAHELMEVLFAALPYGKGWAARRIGSFQANVKERLCNEGAAELLMPVDTFRPRVLEYGVSFASGRRLAEEYRVSTTAALVQMARVGPGRHAVVLWKYKHKPVEVRTQSNANQLSFFASQPARAPKKLRVEWSLSGPDVPYIPPAKSVPDGTTICAAWNDGTFSTGVDWLDLGKFRGNFLCESQPFDAADERFVLSLLHFPDDDCPWVKN